MILKCPKCNGMMKVDENLIPKTESFKVRCPHCSEIDNVPHPASPAPAAESAPDETSKESRSRHPPLLRSRPPEVARTAGDAPGAGEPTMPSDAFDRFRFPAEQDADEEPKPRLGTKARILVWAGLSLAVVVFFALIVNFVLRGPAGQKPDLGFVPPAMESGNGSAPSDQPGR